MSESRLQSLHQSRLRADLTLLLVAILWGSSFAAQRTAALANNVHLYNGIRFLLGAALLTPFLYFRHVDLKTINMPAWSGSIAAGVFMFLGTAFQQNGMRFTTAANAGFITGLYVVIVPLVLAFGLRRPPRVMIWLAGLIALAGMFLLSTGGRLSLTSGDAWELAGAFMWAFHVLTIDWTGKRMDTFLLAVIQSSICGTLSLFTNGLVEKHTLASLNGIWWAVFYTAFFSITLGFTLQVFGQKSAPPADASILLSGESVFAALFGWIILGEGLLPVQILGCGLMLAGMILAQLSPYIQLRSQKTNHQEESYG